MVGALLAEYCYWLFDSAPWLENMLTGYNCSSGQYQRKSIQFKSATEGQLSKIVFEDFKTYWNRWTMVFCQNGVLSWQFGMLIYWHSYEREHELKMPLKHNKSIIQTLHPGTRSQSANCSWSKETKEKQGIFAN